MWKVKFYRINTCTDPMMRQETDVIFRTELIPKDDGFNEIMWKEMWKQNPAWLLSHGPSTVNFRGWSSVMYDMDTLEKVEQTKKDIPEDLTGEGNEFTPITYHPLLPHDLRIALRKAYERGLTDKKIYQGNK